MDQLRGRLRGPGEGIWGMAGQSRLKVAIVSTLPPRQCGIATFAANLCAAIRGTEAPVDLEFVAIEHQEQPPPGGVGQRGQTVKNWARLNHPYIRM